MLQTKPTSPTLEVHTVSQPSVTGEQPHKNENSSTTRNTSSTSQQNINLKNNKSLPKKDLDYTAFYILLGLSFLLFFVNWLLAIIVYITACCVAPQTPQQKADAERQKLEAKRKSEEQELEAKRKSEELSALKKTEFQQKAESLTEVIKKGLLDTNEQVTFYQMATYKGGIRGYPNSAQSSGFAFVIDHSFVFYDKDISFKVLYEQVKEAKLDFFQLGGVRGILGLGDVGRQLQQTKNILELSYLDDENTERSAKFQINGALTIPGEAERAVEFLNYLLEFKGKFMSKSTGDIADPLSRLEKLKKLKDQGVITESEFEGKKRGLLDQL